MRRILRRLDCRVFVVACRLVGAVKPARRKDARHLLHIAAAVKREVVHERHIRIGMIVSEILAVIQPPDGIAVFRRERLFEKFTIVERDMSVAPQAQ